MATEEYIALNKANWDERAPEHARAPAYAVQRLISDPTALSDVVTSDIPRFPEEYLRGKGVVHLQCHIGTDTLSLARRGARSVTGLDFSSVSITEARKLADATRGSGGEKVRFVEASVYDAVDVLGRGEFDVVFSGVGAICWLPDIRRWANVVSALLKPGGRFFFREGHPILWTLDEHVTTDLKVRYPYFEMQEAMVFEETSTYVKLDEESEKRKEAGGGFKERKTMEWNHGLGEIVQAVIDAGMEVTGLVEHRTLPWEGLPGQMVEVGGGEFALKEGRDRIPLSYTLQAVKKS